jgi:hypothetical protein
MANQAIRQELNVLTGNRTSTGTSNAIGQVTLDTTAYSGTPTYIFEAVYKGAASNTGTIKLRRVGTSTDDASLAGATSTTAIITRSTSFSPPVGQTQYMCTLVGDGVRSQTVVAARIIVLQSEVVITQSQTQVEIGTNEANQTNTVASAQTNPKYWLYTAANWNGVLAFSVEAVWQTSAKNTTTITLQEDNGSFASWADKVTIVSAGTSSTGLQWTRVLFGFAPTTGRNYRISALSSTSKSSYTIANAKIIIDQSAAIDAQLYDESAGNLIQGATGTGQKAGQSFTAGASYNCDTINVKLSKIGSPVDNLTLEVLTTSITGTVVATSSAFVGSGLTTIATWSSFTFSSFAIASGTKYYLRLSRSGARDLGNYYSWTGSVSSVLANGGSYSDSSGTWSSESTTNDLCFQIISTPITALAKCEPQYLLLNQADSGTGSQNMLAIWNSSEWDAGTGTITYKHAHDATNAADSSRIGDVTASTFIANSTVTGANQQISAALGAFVTGNTLDTNVITSTGVVGASRILVLYSFVAAAAITLPDLIMQPLLPPCRRR